MNERRRKLESVKRHGEETKEPCAWKCTPQTHPKCHLRSNCAKAGLLSSPGRGDELSLSGLAAPAPHKSAPLWGIPTSRKPDRVNKPARAVFPAPAPPRAPVNHSREAAGERKEAGKATPPPLLLLLLLLPPPPRVKVVVRPASIAPPLKQTTSQGSGAPAEEKRLLQKERAAGGWRNLADKSRAPLQSCCCCCCFLLPAPHGRRGGGGGDCLWDQSPRGNQRRLGLQLCSQARQEALGSATEPGLPVVLAEERQKKQPGPARCAPSFLRSG
ncbi:uncharacterized protein LOC125427746 [Sphaerodactylus townsendi]|uniref:uncharacterized protein LOC125427746 n=1 Tax=Sphaerodactylus townsendi TaxID=933632 RepID=UPI002026DF47|nr:uncharacterized protein LOC125427746 [Sphaerodactylus townsendi]